MPPPHPPSSEGSVFPPGELYLGLSEAKSNSFPSLPHPHRKPGGHRPGNTFKSLLSASRTPPLGDKVGVPINQSWVLGGMDRPFCGSHTVLALQTAHTRVKKGATGPLLSSGHQCFHNTAEGPLSATMAKTDTS